MGTLRLVTGLGAVGLALAVAQPVVTVARMTESERIAARALTALVEAQRGFRHDLGHGGYAATLASLTTACPGAPAPPLAIDRELVNARYALVLTPSERAIAGPPDCHGVATTSDYYAAVQPATELAGREAMAVTSRGRVYVFFDGIAPREADMATGGLAIPLDRLSAFKIP